jgi:hypothetical protein
VPFREALTVAVAVDGIAPALTENPAVDAPDGTTTGDETDKAADPDVTATVVATDTACERDTVQEVDAP